MTKIHVCCGNCDIVGFLTWRTSWCRKTEKDSVASENRGDQISTPVADTQEPVKPADEDLILEEEPFRAYEGNNNNNTSSTSDKSDCKDYQGEAPVPQPANNHPGMGLQSYACI